MNLCRLGHYFIPNGERHSCLVALVVHEWTDTAWEEKQALVNIVVWDDYGESNVERSVVVAAPDVEGRYGTFHLSGDCPWQR